MAKHNETRVRLEGFIYGPLEGVAYMPHPDLPAYGYHVMSDCGKVSMIVNTTRAEGRLEDAKRYDTQATFYYD